MRGGKRPGAGRPRGSDRRMVSLRLPRHIADWLISEADKNRYSQSKLIVDALVSTYEIPRDRQPEPKRNNPDSLPVMNSGRK